MTSRVTGSGIVRAHRLVAVAGLAAALALAACAPPQPSATQPRLPLKVVAAENFWGNLAEQLGGEKVQVTSVISNPNADPHDYEPTVADAREVASADLVVGNGLGYDAWVPRLLAASPNPRRVELEAGAIAGAVPGSNPHVWYSPSAVHRIISAITEGYKQLDPSDSAYFEARRVSLETSGFARYDALASSIARDFSGTPIGASESLVAPLAEALRLNLITPPTFLSAVSEGVDPSAADKATADAQIKSRAIKVLIYNRQNSTPDVVALVAEAKAAGIPVVTITETLQPAGETFQQWQTTQLAEVQAALQKAKGR